MTASERRSYSVYIMGSLSGTLCVGFTGNLHKRIFQHKFEHIEGFTQNYEVNRLLYWASFDDVHKAIAREKQLKGWRREKKTALIESRNPCWLDLAKEWYQWMESGGTGRDASTVEDRPLDDPPPLSMTTADLEGKKMKLSEKRPLRQLEIDTAAYYENMTEEEVRAEQELENAIVGAAKGVDFDDEE